MRERLRWAGPWLRYHWDQTRWGAERRWGRYVRCPLRGHEFKMAARGCIRCGKPLRERPFPVTMSSRM